MKDLQVELAERHSALHLVGDVDIGDGVQTNI